MRRSSDASAVSPIPRSTLVRVRRPRRRQLGSGDPAAGRPKRRGKVKKRHTVGRVLLVTAVVLALVTGLSTLYLYRHYNGNLDVIDVTAQLGTDRPEKKKVEGPKEPLNILVMGSDDRDAPGNNIDNLTGGGKRSDTTILLHLSADRKRAYGISIPRDSLVDRPVCYDEDMNPIAGGTDVMWNDAFSVGGPACTMRQVEQLTGISIDHFVVVDFQGFRGMVDAIGGVQVCIPEPGIQDPAHGINIPAGTRKLVGYPGAQLRARALRARQRLRHRPDEAPAGVHRRDGPPGAQRQHAGQPGPPAEVPRGRHLLAPARQGPGQPGEDRQARHGVPGHRPGQHPVHHRAVAVRPGRPEPDPLAAGGRPGLADDHRRREDAGEVPRRRHQRRAPPGSADVHADGFPDRFAVRFADRYAERHTELADHVADRRVLGRAEEAPQNGLCA